MPKKPLSQQMQEAFLQSRKNGNTINRSLREQTDHINRNIDLGRNLTLNHLNENDRGFYIPKSEQYRKGLLDGDFIRKSHITEQDGLTDEEKKRLDRELAQQNDKYEAELDRRSRSQFTGIDPGSDRYAGRENEADVRSTINTSDKIGFDPNAPGAQDAILRGQVRDGIAQGRKTPVSSLDAGHPEYYGQTVALSGGARAKLDTGPRRNPGRDRAAQDIMNQTQSQAPIMGPFGAMGPSVGQARKAQLDAMSGEELSKEIDAQIGRNFRSDVSGIGARTAGRGGATTTTGGGGATTTTGGGQGNEYNYNTKGFVGPPDPKDTFTPDPDSVITPGAQRLVNTAGAHLMGDALPGGGLVKDDSPYNVFDPKMVDLYTLGLSYPTRLGIEGIKRSGVLSTSAGPDSVDRAFDARERLRQMGAGVLSAEELAAKDQEASRQRARRNTSQGDLTDAEYQFQQRAMGIQRGRSKTKPPSGGEVMGRRYPDDFPAADPPSGGEVTGRRYPDDFPSADPPSGGEVTGRRYPDDFPSADPPSGGEVSAQRLDPPVGMGVSPAGVDPNSGSAIQFPVTGSRRGTMEPDVGQRTPAEDMDSHVRDMKRIRSEMPFYNPIDAIRGRPTNLVSPEQAELRRRSREAQERARGGR
jgi:hypothetical protein